MMNGVTGIGANNSNYQTAFRGKMSKAEKRAYKIIDKINDNAVEFLNKNRSKEEKTEIAIRNSVSKFVKKFFKKS